MQCHSHIYCRIPSEDGEDQYVENNEASWKFTCGDDASDDGDDGHDGDDNGDDDHDGDYW